MLVFEVAEGLIVKEHAKADSWVELFDHNESIIGWHQHHEQGLVQKGNRTVLDTRHKPSCEYSWNELKDYMRTMIGARDLCSLGHKLVRNHSGDFEFIPVV